jgi:hypothetical protein
MQLVVNFENTSQLDLIKSLLVQNGFTSFFVEEDEQSDEDDLEDAYLLKLANERRNEPMISAETLLYNLKQAGKLD